MHSKTKNLKVAQTMLRHSRPDITAGTYIHGVPEENLRAQELYMTAILKGQVQANAENLMKAKPASATLQ